LKKRKILKLENMANQAKTAKKFARNIKKGVKNLQKIAIVDT
jgi:hypothetical protein